MALRLQPSRLLLAGGSACVGVLLGVLAGIDPRLAIIASVACAYVLLTFADLSAGLAVFMFLSFLDVLSVGGPGSSLMKVLGLVLALSWLAMVATRNEQRSELLSAHPLASYALALLVGWSALSAAWAEDPAAAIDFAYRLLLNAVLFVIVYTAVRDRRSAMLAVAAFVAGAAAAAIYGLIESPEVAGAPGRLAAGVLDPNELGSVLVGGVALSLGLAGSSKRGTGGSTLAIATAGFCLVALLLTASRGGLIALAIAMVAAIVFAGRWRGITAALVIMVAAAGAFYFTAAAPDSARDRIEQVTQGEAAQQEGRATIWLVGWRMFEANPVAGVGAGNFSEAAIEYVVQPGAAPRSDRLVSEPAVAHNSYLEMLSELGLIGAGLFLALIGFSIGSGVAAARRFNSLGNARMEILSRALVIAVIGVLAADFFISQQASKQLWLLLGLGPAFLGIATRDRAREPH